MTGGNDSNNFFIFDLAGNCLSEVTGFDSGVTIGKMNSDESMLVVGTQEGKLHFYNSSFNL